jgi:phospholipase C
VGINRREFLRSAAGAASAAALVGVQSGNQSDAQAFPSPSASQIEHIVVVMMENRSFDHFLGGLPG